MALYSPQPAFDLVSGNLTDDTALGDHCPSSQEEKEGCPAGLLSVACPQHTALCPSSKEGARQAGMDEAYHPMLSRRRGTVQNITRMH